MEETKTLSLETNPLFVSAKNLKNEVSKGIFCRRSGEELVRRIVQIENDNYILLDEEGKESNVTEGVFKSHFEILFFVGNSSLPDPEALFLIDGEWVLAGVTDLMGNQIKDSHMVVVKPKNVGWKKNSEERISLMDINKILDAKKINIETEEITIGRTDSINLPFVANSPKIREGKVLFILN